MVALCVSPDGVADHCGDALAGAYDRRRHALCPSARAFSPPGSRAKRRANTTAPTQLTTRGCSVSSSNCFFHWEVKIEGFNGLGWPWPPAPRAWCKAWLPPPPPCFDCLLGSCCCVATAVAVTFSLGYTLLRAAGEKWSWSWPVGSHVLWIPRDPVVMASADLLMW